MKRYPNKRHTMPVEDFKALVNDMLENDNLSQSMKLGICLALENVLHATHNYRGFNYYAWVKGGCEQWIKDGRPDNNKPYLGQEYDRVYY